VGGTNLNPSKHLQNKIEQYAIDAGASIIGFSFVGNNLDHEYLLHYSYAITIGVKLLDGIIDEIIDAPTFSYFKHYRSVNVLLDELALKIGLIIEVEGYKAYPIAASQTIPDTGNGKTNTLTALFQHKTAAVRAGLGYIGKNALFISSEFGPRVRLVTVLTNYKFETTNHVAVCECKSCRLCVEACPAMAIKGAMPCDGISRDELIDARACSEYMNKHFKNIGRGSVCGICVSVCPAGQR
jgi:epoxyqueuosine reductase QueG